VSNQEDFKKKKAENNEEEEVDVEKEKIDQIRETPLNIGTLEEIIDENHGIVSISGGGEYYVPILSFVDKDQLEPNCTIIGHAKSIQQLKRYGGGRHTVGRGRSAVECHEG
jgi:26S proteasome regulatory subunit T2